MTPTRSYGDREGDNVLPKGPAKKVTIYVNEDTRYHSGPLWSAVFNFLQHKRVAGATVLRPVLGFGAHHYRHGFQMEATMEHMPIRIEFVDVEERVNEVLPTLYDMVQDGLIEVQDTTVVKDVMEEHEVHEQRYHSEIRGTAKMMRIFLGEADRWKNEPLYEALVKQLRTMDVAGATVYRGVLGYGLKGQTHKAHLLRLHDDLPMMISVVDKEEKIAAAIEAIAPMLLDALIVLSDAEIIRLIHSLPPGDPPPAN
jgi:PII-like signaling protein